MNYVKLSKEEKIKQREARKEFQIIVKRCRAIGFEYVIVRPPQTKLCFGSNIEREVLPRSDTTSAKLGPGSYDLTYYRNQDHPTIKQKTAKQGYGSLANKSARIHDVEYDKSSKLYYPPEKFIKPHFQPFGFSIKMNKSNKLHNFTPGPGSYSNFIKTFIFQHSFGGKIKVKPAVEMICNPKNLAICTKCDKMPIGDYWKNWINNKDICHNCIATQIYETKNKLKNRLTRRKILKELENYSLVRYCGFYHDHQNTTAAVRLLTNSELKRKFRIENYLSMFNL